MEEPSDYINVKIFDLVDIIFIYFQIKNILKVTIVIIGPNIL